VASIKQAVDNQEILSTTGKFHVNYNAGYRTPSGEGNMPINYDKIDRESLEKWAGRQVHLHKMPQPENVPETENFGPGM
jgi:hypothetical protein